MQLAGIKEGREWLQAHEEPQTRPLPVVSEWELERKEQLAERYQRDPGLLQRIAPYERSRRYYANRGIDLRTMPTGSGGASGGGGGGGGGVGREEQWWDLLSLQTPATAAAAATATSGSGSSRGSAGVEEAAEAADKAAARVRLCADAYCAFWRGLSVQEKVEEKDAAAAYVREFLIAVVEGARGTPPEQVREHQSVYYHHCVPGPCLPPLPSSLTIGNSLAGLVCS